MESYEDIHEAMVATRQENARLRTDAEHADLLLSSIASLLRLDLDADPFATLFDTLQSVLHFDQALALTQESDDRLACVASQPELHGEVTWPIGRFFSKVMNGRIAATFDNGRLEEWRDIPPDYLSAAQPGLYLPLQVRDERGVLILLRANAEDGFDRDDIALAGKFSLAASHALAASADRRIIRDNMARALAAEEATRAKDMFMATMSHELKTPLNAIIGFAEILADPEPLPAEHRIDYASDIRMSGQHLLAIVSDLLLYTQLEAGRYNVCDETITVDTEISNALRLLEVAASEKDMRFDWSSVSTGHRVVADRQSLRQILINIAGNAVKFSPPGSAIDVRVYGDETTDMTVIELRDRGPGIAPETLARIGEPFVQAETDYSRRHQGTGLGLAISIGLARQMNGTLMVDSKPGEGTTVRLALPVPLAGADRTVPEAIARSA